MNTNTFMDNQKNEIAALERIASEYSQASAGSGSVNAVTSKNKSSQNNSKKNSFLQFYTNNIMFPAVALVLSAMFLGFNAFIFVSRNEASSNRVQVLGKTTDTSPSNHSSIEEKSPSGYFPFTKNKLYLTESDYTNLINEMGEKLLNENSELISYRKSVVSAQVDLLNSNSNISTQENYERILATIDNAQEQNLRNQATLDDIRGKINSGQTLSVEDRLFLLSI